MAQWADENGPFLHPNQDQVLTIDLDLVALGVKFDQPEFFDKVLADLSSQDPVRGGRAQRLLGATFPLALVVATRSPGPLGGRKISDSHLLRTQATTAGTSIRLPRKKACRRASCAVRLAPVNRSRMSRPPGDFRLKHSRRGAENKGSDVRRSFPVFC